MNKKNYHDLLSHPLWLQKRNQILTRDKNTCQFCGAQDKYLHVHHKYYEKDKNPWEYPNEALVTLCDDCHEYMHNNTPNDKIRIGDIFAYFHSDWCMNYIVYDVNAIRRTVRVLGCDDGGGTDSIYDDEYTLEWFFSHCSLIEEPQQLNGMFENWLSYVLNNLNNTPAAFRYNINEILKSNSLFQKINF